jgi:hypothetical protein
MSDVKSSLEFELKMAYDDQECDIFREDAGVYRAEIIIQHKDEIVTQVRK